MNVSWEVQGLKELDKQLANLGAKGGLKVLRKAARKGMGPVKNQMEDNAPFDSDKDAASSSFGNKLEAAARSEHLKDKIKMTSKKLDKKGGSNNALTVRVGPTRAHAQKAIAAEYGTTKQQAEPFMRPALFDNKDQVIRTMKNVLVAEIQRAIRGR